MTLPSYCNSDVSGESADETSTFLHEISGSLVDRHHPIYMFQKYCRDYYLISLGVSTVDTNDTPGSRNVNQSHSSDGELFTIAEVVLEALEHQLLISFPPSQPYELDRWKTNDLVLFLSKQTVQKYWHIIQSCGLLLDLHWNQIHAKTLITTGSGPKEEIITDAKPSIAKHFLQYVQIRDQTRQFIHNVAMSKRIQCVKTIIEKHQDTSATLVPLTAEFDCSSSQITKSRFVSHVQKKIRFFLSKYKKYSGVHPILAGVRKLAEKQLSQDDDRIILWKFQLLTLSECGFQHTQLTDYICEVLDLLSTFMVMITSNHLHSTENQSLESGLSESAKDVTNEYIAFLIHPALSNNNVNHILGELSPSHKLDAVATGEFKILDATEAVRLNKVGKYDEKFTLYWPNDVLKFCTIL